MMEWISFFTSIGRVSIDYLWIPLGLWTVVAIPLLLISRILAANQPIIHYHGCMALLLSLPLGFLIMPLTAIGVNSIGITSDISTFFDTFVKIIPVDNEGSFAVGDLDASELPGQSINDESGGLAIIGVLTFLALLISAYSVINLFYKVKKLELLNAELKPVKKPTAVAIMRELTDQLSINRSITLMQEPSGTVPYTYGWKRPVVVIPEDVISEPEVLRTTLFHELIHVRRNDYLAGLITRFVTALFVFYPIVFFLGRQIRAYRELSCDSEVIGRKATTPGDYARLLLRFNTPARFPITISMVQTISNLRKRVQFMDRYANFNLTKSRIIRILLLPVAILLPTFIMSCSSQHANSDSSGVVQKSVVIEDMSVSLKLPEGWVEYQKPIRKTLADRLGELSEEEFKTVDTDHPEKLEHGGNFYTYNNLDKYGSIPEEDLFGYFLTIEMHDYFNEERRDLWKRGQCSPGHLCAGWLNPDLNLIRELGSEENPFDTGTGFLYEVKTESESALLRWIFIYYIVEGEKCYRVSYHGLARDLQNGAFSELLAGIDFTV